MINFNRLDINFDKNRIEWNPHELKENIFLLLGIIKSALCVKLIGNPHEIEDGKYKYAIDFEEV